MILVPSARIEEYTARGWWGQTTLWDLFQRHLRDKPDALAVADPVNRADIAHGAPARLTWAMLAERIDRCSALLLRSGVARDDIVVMQLPNSVEQLVVYLSCARLGIIVSPVPVQYRDHELEHILRQTQARAAITFTRIGRAASPHAAVDMFMRLRESNPGLRDVIAWGETVPAGCVDASAADDQPLSDAERAAVQAAEAAAGVTANDVLTVCWTSGTEATPKGVPRSHNEWLIVAPSIIEAADVRPGAVLLNPFPLVNMAGLSTGLASWLLLGGTLIQHHPFNLDVFLQQVRDEGVDYTVAAPAVLNMLLQNEHLLEGIDFARLHRIGSGSAPLSEWMVRGFAERFGVQIVNYFGSNEGAALTGTPRDIPEPELRAQFFPRVGVPGYEWSVSTTRKIATRLIDLETGQEIREAGRPGELRFRGPTIFSGYYRAPELTERAFDEQGYYRTGDLFQIAGDRLQFYHYVGRSKDLVIRGGMNISSEELENLLQAMPGVKEAAVVGVPDELLGERVCACVVARPGQALTLAQVVAHLRDHERIAAYKLPERLLVLDELPRNPVGKILKRELRLLAQQSAVAAGAA